MQKVFRERKFQLGSESVFLAVLDAARQVQWYANDQSLWIRYTGDKPELPFKDVPEADIQKLMAPTSFKVKERRKGSMPDRRIVEWTR